MSPAAYLALFGAGVASFLAPCVMPLVPAYVGMLVGATSRSPGTVAASGALFVLGFSAVFVSLGALAAEIGSNLDDVQMWVMRTGGLLVIAFGLILLGVLRGRFLAERRLVLNIERGTGTARPVVMGVAFGAAWTPCVGPLLGSALVVAAGTSNAWRGALLLAAYAAGVGIPFVLAALALTASPTLLAKLRSASKRIEPIAGIALVALGLLLVTGTYDHVLGPLGVFAPQL